MNCFCGTDESYEMCCEPFHKNLKNASTAEILMRSRYSAYVVQNADYLLATWYKNTRPVKIDFSDENVAWQKLEIISVKKGGIKDDKGRVEFNAFYIESNKTFVMHEVSRFKKFGGKWFYVDGVIG